MGRWTMGKRVGPLLFVALLVASAVGPGSTPDRVDFGNLDLQGTQAVVTNASSPYVGWPIAYDPKSLGTYLLTGYPDGTWFANTTRVGLGPFDVVHTIKVDGRKDLRGVCFSRRLSGRHEHLP